MLGQQQEDNQADQQPAGPRCQIEWRMAASERQVMSGCISVWVRWHHLVFPLYLKYLGELVSVVLTSEDVCPCSESLSHVTNF